MLPLFKRLLFIAPLLLVISLLSFVLLHVAPGGPFDKERKPSSPDVERNLMARYHLDEPLWKQYLRYLGVGWERNPQGELVWFRGGLLHGDLGPSMIYRAHTVNDIIRQGLPVSLTLGVLAFLFALGVGIPLGIYTAARRGRWGDYLGSFFALLAFCIPGFVVGPLLIMGFAIHWRWFPVGLWESPLHVVLPTVALGLYFAGRVSRLLREGMTAALREPFIIAARAKGLSELRIFFKHALRVAVLPVVSYSGPMLADLLTGSFVAENIFCLPGIGVFLVNASLNRDYTLVVGLVLLYAALLLALNLIVDFSYSLLDRRVKWE